VHYSLFVLISVGVLMLIAGFEQYRRGDRWLLSTLLVLPAGVMLGIYAGDHHQRALGIPAFALIVAYPITTRAGRRQRAKSVARRTLQG
jgi:hypothetical protein